MVDAPGTANGLPAEDGAFVEHAGALTYYEVIGRGEPLVLYHGFTASGEEWKAYGYVAALKDDYRVILIDARGHGRSGKPLDPELNSTEIRVGDIIAVLDAVGV